MTDSNNYDVEARLEELISQEKDDEAYELIMKNQYLLESDKWKESFAVILNNKGEYKRALQVLSGVKNTETPWWHYYNSYAKYSLGELMEAGQYAESALRINDSLAENDEEKLSEEAKEDCVLFMKYSKEDDKEREEIYKREFRADLQYKVRRYLIDVFGRPADIDYSYIVRTVPGFEEGGLDVLAFPPTEDRRFWVVATAGLSSYPLCTDNDVELGGSAVVELADGSRSNVPLRTKRMELAAAMPEGWKFDGKRKTNTWIIKYLAETAGQLAQYKADVRHWIFADEPYNRRLPAKYTFTHTFFTCDNGLGLPIGRRFEEKGDWVRFYQYFPLYDQEIARLNSEGSDFIVRHLHETNGVVEFGRGDISKSQASRSSEFYDLLEWHLQEFKNKDIEVSELNLLSHMAFILEWAKEKGLLSEDFKTRCADEIKRIEAGSLDWRRMIQSSRSKGLERSAFTEEARRFLDCYYNLMKRDPRFSYPADVDRYCLEFFGREKYESGVFKDYAYHNLPYIRRVRADMIKVIQMRFEDFMSGSADAIGGQTVDGSLVRDPFVGLSTESKKGSETSYELDAARSMQETVVIEDYPSAGVKEKAEADSAPAAAPKSGNSRIRRGRLAALAEDKKEDAVGGEPSAEASETDEFAHAFKAAGAGAAGRVYLQTAPRDSELIVGKDEVLAVSRYHDFINAPAASAGGREYNKHFEAYMKSVSAVLPFIIVGASDKRISLLIDAEEESLKSRYPGLARDLGFEEASPDSIFESIKKFGEPSGFEVLMGSYKNWFIVMSPALHAMKLIDYCSKLSEYWRSSGGRTS